MKKSLLLLSLMSVVAGLSAKSVDVLLGSFEYSSAKGSVIEGVFIGGGTAERLPAKAYCAVAPLPQGEQAIGHIKNPNYRHRGRGLTGVGENCLISIGVSEAR